MGDNEQARMPERPDLPPPRVQYNGLMFGSPAELAAWKSEPWWRRCLGLTAYDLKMRRRPGGRWGG